MMNKQWTIKEPKKDGLYAVKYYPYDDKSREPAYCVFKRENGEWIDFLEGKFANNKTYAFAWLEIEPFGWVKE